MLNGLSDKFEHKRINEAGKCAFAHNVPNPLNHVLPELSTKWGRDKMGKR